MASIERAPTETDIALANGNPPSLRRYDPTAAEPEFLFEVVNDFIVRKTAGSSEIDIATTLYNVLAPIVRATGFGRTYMELGYDFSDGGPRRKPDVSVLSAQRWPRSKPFPLGDFVPVAPELAVEVISPGELAYVVFSKIEQYFRARVLAVWVIVPHIERVYCFDSATAIRVLSRTDDLTGEPLIPGFRLPLAELFPPTS